MGRKACERERETKVLHDGPSHAITRPSTTELKTMPNQTAISIRRKLVQVPLAFSGFHTACTRHFDLSRKPTGDAPKWAVRIQCASSMHLIQVPAMQFRNVHFLEGGF